MRPITLILMWGLIWSQEENLILRRVARGRGYQPSKTYLYGRVIDQRTGEPLPGATVRLGQQGTYTDSRGYFTLEYTQSGDTLFISMPEYQSQQIVLTRSIQIIASLKPVETELAPVQIVETADRTTESSVAVERLRSLEISDAYTGERIMKRTTDFYVPNVLRRLPGVSLLSGRWVSIRGLGERYNAFAFWPAYPAWLRYDASMPAVNEIVSTLLGRIEIRKVWTPELLGHFGGGMIDFQLPEGGEEGHP